MRQELARRPLLLASGGLILGLIASEQPTLIPILIALILLANGIGWRGGIVGAFLAGILLSPPEIPHLEQVEPYEGIGVIAGMPDISSQGQRAVMAVDGLHYLLITRDRLLLSAGDRVRVYGTRGPLRNSLTLASNERTLSGEIRTDRPIEIVGYGPSIFRLASEWRASFAAFVDRVCVRQAATALKALCFNITADLDQKTYTDLRRTGTVHIISASGLHVFIFAAGLGALMSLLPIPRGYRLALIGVVLAVYAIGAGMKPPVIRSVLMAAMLASAPLLRREPDLLSALGLTAIAYLVYRPVAIFDVGFQFSFVTVAALGMFLQIPESLPAAPLPRLRALVWEAAKASFVATAASAPLSAYHFGTVSLMSVPANAMIALVIPAVTLTTFAAHAISGILPALAVGLVVGLAQPLVGWILWVAQALSRFEFASVEIPAFAPIWMAPYFLALLLLWRPRARPI